MTVSFGLAIKNFVGPTETPDIDELYRYAARAEELEPAERVVVHVQRAARVGAQARRATAIDRAAAPDLVVDDRHADPGDLRHSVLADGDHRRRAVPAHEGEVAG